MTPHTSPELFFLLCFSGMRSLAWKHRNSQTRRCLATLAPAVHACKATVHHGTALIVFSQGWPTQHKTLWVYAEPIQKHSRCGSCRQAEPQGKLVGAQNPDSKERSDSTCIPWVFCQCKSQTTQLTVRLVLPVCR